MIHPFPPKPGATTASPDPLSFAVAARDRDTVAMVTRAVDEDNVMLAFQPVVPALRDDRPAFYEGLIRLLDASGRIIPARDFMSTVEPTELGRRIDTLSITHGLEVLHHRPRLRLAINVSARSIGHSPWLEALERGITRDPTVAERLILEISERSTIELPQMVGDFMQAMQLRGLSFALDDFGEGYTSLKYLKDLYFDIVKIDGQFVRGIAGNPDNRALIKAIVSIGRHFDMVTIAEQVETRADAATLAKLGVDCLQGYYFGAPTIRPRWEPAGVPLRTGSDT
ncbi:EAL domain, c-di-GMP-specific phosphodiesterase class I (or its enzymatically inactive variant) [Palleronia salina]|uniref:EAL domain, c-di-GMP-specific phosphodiesterase class I (Or its enzymatically inactive variant) n=1 Tax=Palleronia salina TaxID=313368 RepID=A0A1M6EMK4_9RHOB|nr:EAL domain-containing protein [Palleronia salina]SHI86767.1 EAL domain, c-di-GMP-specific phosphodiesterase class I (or its enzymatically inactive variant) [Palleronia salina]